MKQFFPTYAFNESRVIHRNYQSKMLLKAVIINNSSQWQITE